MNSWTLFHHEIVIDLKIFQDTCEGFARRQMVCLESDFQAMSKTEIFAGSGLRVPPAAFRMYGEGCRVSCFFFFPAAVRVSGVEFLSLPPPPPEDGSFQPSRASRMWFTSVEQTRHK